MPWIPTHMGHSIDLVRPQPANMVLADISFALARIPRFTGHSCRPYSVAEHSLLVAEIMEKCLGQTTPGALFAALMHDAHEAYIGDMSAPVKLVLGEAWANLEGRLQRTLRQAFALHTHSHDYAAWIKQADLIALATERAALMPEGGPLWESIVHVQPWGGVDLMSPQRLAMRWDDWRDRFHELAEQLDRARDKGAQP